MPEQRKSADPQKLFGKLSISEWHRVPLRERVVDRLASLMFDADDLLEMFTAEDRGHDFQWLEPDIRHMYDRVNELMHRMTN